MKTPKKATVDFGGALTDDISRKGSRLFPVEYDDSDLGIFNRYLKHQSTTAETKQKFNKQIANRSSGGSSKNSLLPRSSQFPRFVFHLYDNRFTKKPKKASAKDVIKIIKWHLHDNPTILDRWPEFRKPSFIRRFAKMQLDEEERRHRKNENTKAVYSAFVLKEIESSTYCGRLHLDKRGKVINEIQAIVSEFLIEQTFFMPTLGDSSGGKLFLRRDLPTAGAKGGMDIFSLSQTNIPAIVNDALYLKARKILGLLWELSDAGDNGALLKIAKTLLPNISALNKKLSVQPDALDLWPKSLPSWPVMKSPHPSFDCDHVDLLKNLKVGEGFPMRFDKGARWENNLITKWAIHLIEEIEYCRGWLCDYPDLPDTVREQLSKLQKLSLETWLAWWDAAKELLEHCYVDLATIPELQNWSISPKARSKNMDVRRGTAKSKDEMKPGKIRARINEALKQKFKTLAGVERSR